MRDNRWERWPPDRYPTAYHRALRDGIVEIPLGDLQWAPTSSALRFRDLIRKLRTLPHHPLHGSAMCSWHTTKTETHLIILRKGQL